MPRDRYNERDDQNDDREDHRRDEDYDRPRRRRDDEDYDRPRRRRDYDDPPKSGGGGKVLIIVLGVVGVVVVLLGVGVYFAFMRVKEAGARVQASNNSKQIGLALLNYNDSYGKFPGPYVGPTDGGLPASANPSERLSWRYSILPYIEQDYVYRTMQPSQAWNSPANQAGANTFIKPFGDPLDPPAASTRFRCFYNNGALFDTDPTKRVAVYAIPDGSSNTVIFAESSEMVPWAQFNEFAFEPNGNPPALGHPSRDVFMVGMADCSVRMVKKSVSPSTLKSAINRADGLALGSDW